MRPDKIVEDASLIYSGYLIGQSIKRHPGGWMIAFLIIMTMSLIESITEWVEDTPENRITTVMTQGCPEVYYTYHSSDGYCYLKPGIKASRDTPDHAVPGGNLGPMDGALENIRRLAAHESVQSTTDYDWQGIADVIVRVVTIGVIIIVVSKVGNKPVPTPIAQPSHPSGQPSGQQSARIRAVASAEFEREMTRRTRQS